MIREGAEAPNFTATDDEGNRFELRALRGSPVVLHFFALAWSGVCANELARLGETVPEVASLGAHVLGVSCDSRLTLAAWKQAMRYPVRLLSDFWPHGDIGRKFGVFDEELGVDHRGTFVIDGQGVVRTVISAEMSRARDVSAYVGAVRELL